MADKITIGCRLPHGIILRHPMHESDSSKAVEIRGLNKSQIIGAPYITTQIDREFWTAWLLMNEDFSALKNGSLFAVNDSADASIAARDFEGKKTGFEKADPKDHNVKTADKD